MSEQTAGGEHHHQNANGIGEGFTLIELPAVSRAKRVGFTLIELLVVIAIIAIFTSMLLPDWDKRKCRRKPFSSSVTTNKSAWRVEEIINNS